MAQHFQKNITIFAIIFLTHSITMSKSFIDKAYAVVPEFENRISRFDKKLRIAQYAEHSIYDYKLKMGRYLF